MKMDDDEAFKKKYHKYKLRVKLWEKDFKKTKGRIPSKYDIREAPREIRDSYRMYYKLKTSFLEDTLNDVLFDDGFDVLEISQQDCRRTLEDINADVDDAPTLPSDMSILLQGNVSKSNATNIADTNFSNIPELSATPHVLTNLINCNENHVIKKFDAVEICEQNAKAWGYKVSRKEPSIATNTEQNKKTGEKSFSSKLKNSLFRSTSFSVRNPRKSLSRSQSQLNGTFSDLSETRHSLADEDEKDALPDLETILRKKAKEQQAAVVIAANPLLSLSNGDSVLPSRTLHMNLNEGWLNRTTAQNSILDTEGKVQMTQNKIETSRNTKSSTETYGMSNIDISKLPPHKPMEHAYVSLTPTENQQTTSQVAATNDSDSVVSDSEEEGLRKTDETHIAKKRRLQLTVSPEQIAATIKKHRIIENQEDTMSIFTEETTSKLRSPLKNIVGSNTPKETKKKRTLANIVDSKTPNERRTERTRAVENVVDPETLNERKTKRTIVVAKRQRTKKEQMRDASGGTKSKPAKKKMSSKPIYKTAEEGMTPRTTRSQMGKKTKSPSEIEIPDEEIKPPNPEDLRFNLALENIELTSVPRIKLSELNKANSVMEQYVNTFTGNIRQDNDNAKRPIENTKRAAERLKLEQKISSGKLNENFVTINIQKKKFARGKKSINFSKYKKNQWKQKKREATLCGPNMDMRGCDGGVMKCFTCGQVGHFAQNCKFKGDALLPLTAQLAEDPSPFPTLEEAESMAAHKAVAMHSRNLSKLPEAGNSAIYREKGNEDELADNDNNDELKGEKDQKDDEDKNKSNLSISNERENNYDDNTSNSEPSDYLNTDEELERIDIDAVINEVMAEEQKSLLVHTEMPTILMEQANITNVTATSAFSCGAVMYSLNDDGTVPAVTPEVMEALRLFGHTDFRKGQDRAVMRILCGLSTLVTLSTGSGKTLCYQLPAYLFSRQKGAITLVISPLVSLMEDQVTGVPHFLRALCLHTNQTAVQRQKTLQMINNGEVDILLVSPEAVVAGERSTGFGSILRQLPPIAFACIDEAHCVSQWSHNFRPSYLMICKVLRKNLGVHTVLGLTATATLPTRLSIIDHLGIVDGEKGVISDTPLPDNLVLSVSKDENRDEALLSLLHSKRFEECHSIIIYCTRRDECERVAGFLRTVLQDRPTTSTSDTNKKSKRKRTNWNAEPYHAGMPASRRRTIQNAFMRNELRIVVATIAFGMGINKSDIRAVIHYNMPRNYESYVQEIGRAGRDGLVSHCHLFLDAHGGDQFELRRHIYSNSLDRHVIRKLLKYIFVPCSCKKILKGASATHYTPPRAENEVPVGGRRHICPGHEIAFSIQQTVQALDIPEENISTLLCYMELDPRWQINVLSSAYITAKVISYGGAKYLKHAAKECPPLAMAIALQIKNGTFDESSNVFEFSVIDIAAAIGWNSGVVKYQLKNLEWINVNGLPRRSPITITFSDLGLRLKVPGDFTSEEIDDALDTLYNRSVTQEQTQLIQLQYVFQGLSSVAYNSYLHCSTESFSHERSDQLKGIVREYFRNDYPKDIQLEIESAPVSDDDIANDVHTLINMYPENNFSGRNIARIFHGISSPNFPALMWWRCKFWRSHAKVDFNHIVRLSNAIIVKLRT